MSASPCADCAKDTTPSDATGSTARWEWYVVHDDLWDAATRQRPARILCIACLERRIGRRLTHVDFPAFPVNDLFDRRWDHKAFSDRTPILVDRLLAGLPHARSA